VVKNNKNRLSLLLALVAAFALEACGSARHIREAQDHFNKASAAENSMRASELGFPAGSRSVPAQSSPRDQYLLALEAASAVISQSKSDLRREKLLGHAYMLQAITLWRLAYYESANYRFVRRGQCAATHPRLTAMSGVMDTIRTDLQRKDPIVLGTRDRVMFVALPGLRDHDKGLFAPDYAGAARCFASAYAVLEQAVGLRSAIRGPLQDDHPVRLYIRLAQLQTLAAWNRRLSTSGLKRSQRTPIIKSDIRPRTIKTANAICALQKGGMAGAHKAATRLLMAIGVPHKCR